MEKRHEILFNQLETYRSYVLDVVSTITREEAEIVPKGFNNNIRWNLGHMYLDQFDWIRAITKDNSNVPEHFRAWFGFGTSPADFTDETPTLEELKGLLKEQPSRIREVYGDKLEVEFAPTEMGMHTIEQVLIRTIFHEGMHLQAILDIKKCIGSK
ncbi:DinB family protein [Bacillus sp. FJAT-49736]|uniref:DinB family protein n=1 Tax=Bacillus sp. FJAT-49736 TaxID=2833582 RepID=UPI001BC9D395|nr:DinB family protein [Bacillus sp. FJAT-49736]MBS4174394.1 DinB family protein [Bacillus sp. FJAT-49736]